MKNLAVLVSNKGTGSNLRAMIEAIEKKDLHAKIAVVVCDSDEAPGIDVATKHKIPTAVCKTNEELLSLLTSTYPVDFICLAGWKKIITENVINAFQHKILNVHPGLIPDKGGDSIKNPDGTPALWNQGKLTDKAMQTFLESKTTYAGSTIHFVTKDVDFGPVVFRGFAKVKSGDTIDSLYSRVKKEENKMFVKALKKLCNT